MSLGVSTTNRFTASRGASGAHAHLVTFNHLCFNSHCERNLFRLYVDADFGGGGGGGASGGTSQACASGADSRSPFALNLMLAGSASLSQMKPAA